MKQANFKQKQVLCGKAFRMILLLAAVFGFSLTMHAQVTIGSGLEPDPNALLDLKEQADGTSRKGFLLPRVALTATNKPAPLANHVPGMTVYNTTSSDTSAPDYSTKHHVSKGFYYNDGIQWVKLHLGAANWFYMPSVSFDTSADAANQTKDLYDLYKSQFTAPAYASAGAPAVVPHIPEAEDLFYYILAADSGVFQNVKISNEGVMTYNVTAAATDCSYINIVFVLK